jgi:hypothetical protein
VAFVAAAGTGARAGAGRAAAGRAGAGRAAAKPKPAAKPAAGDAATSAEQQREAIEAIKDAREEASPPAGDDTSRAPSVRMGRPEPAPAGAGLVLGVLAWAIALNYIRGGVPQVRKLLRAKFLNQTDGGT